MNQQAHPSLPTTAMARQMPARTLYNSMIINSRKVLNVAQNGHAAQTAAVHNPATAIPSPRRQY
jgi:hypothetical protein